MQLPTGALLGWQQRLHSRQLLVFCVRSIFVQCSMELTLCEPANFDQLKVVFYKKLP
jgi:hypothetical protein